MRSEAGTNYRVLSWNCINWFSTRDYSYLRTINLALNLGILATRAKSKSHSIHESRQPYPIIERQQPRLQPRILLRGPVVLAQVDEVVSPPVLGAVEPLIRRVRVLLAFVGDDAPAEHVVGDDEPAGAEEAVDLSRLRLGEDGGQVGRVARLLGVDEDEVIRLVGGLVLETSGDSTVISILLLIPAR